MKTIPTVFLLATAICLSATAEEKSDQSGATLLGGLKKKIDLPRMPWNKFSNNPFDADYRDRASKQALIDEQDYQRAERELIFRWRNSWKKKDVKLFLSLLAKNASIDDFGAAKKKSIRAKEGISEKLWNLYTLKTLSNADAIEKSVRGYLEQFQEIDYLKFDTFEIAVDMADRQPSDMNFSRANLTVRFDLRAHDKNGMMRQDRGHWLASIVQVDGKWKLEKLRLLRAETLTAKEAGFENITKLAGLEAIPTFTRIEAIRRGGYALALGDRRGKGVSDMYVGTWGKGVLLEGDGTGKFKEVREPNVTDLTLVKTATFADLKNQGREDLVMIRFSPNDQNDVLTLSNDGFGHYLKPIALPNMLGFDYAMPAAMGDFNGDEFLDLYVGFPGKKDFTFPSPSLQSVKLREGEKLKVQGLFLNDKDGHWVNNTEKSFGPEGDLGSQVFPHSALALDYDQDGKSDLVVIDDRGNLTPIFKNLGNGVFSNVSGSIGISNSDFGMGVAAGDLFNHGLTDFVFTNVAMLADYRIKKSSNRNFGRIQMGAEEGVRIFMNLGNGKFAEVTSAAELDWPGEGIGGAELVDYNNDGLLDIYVTNGLWSGTSDEEDISSLFSRGRAQWKVWERGVLGENNRHTPEKQEESIWIDILRNFRGSVSTLELSNDRPSMAGYQRNRMYRNNGDGTFTEVGYLLGVDSESDGYIAATADFDKDGKMDLVLRNTDPGSTDHPYPPVEIYKNRMQSGNALVVRLKGTASNRDAIGSRVIARVGKLKIFRELVANNGTAQSEHLLHLGLGTATKVDDLEIHWPSGGVQIMHGLKAGTITITETKKTNRLVPQGK